MFAIIKTGGKQYKVAANEIIKIEKLGATKGDVIEFPEVLMMGEGKSVKVGAPLLSSAKVFGTVVDQIRDDKIIIFKKKRRHNYRRKNGHRQYLTVVQITDLLPEGGKPTGKATALKTEPKVEKPKAETKAKVESAKKTEAKAPVTKKEAPKAKAKTPAAKKVAPVKKAAPAKKAPAAKKVVPAKKAAPKAKK